MAKLKIIMCVIILPPSTIDNLLITLGLGVAVFLVAYDQSALPSTVLALEY